MEKCQFCGQNRGDEHGATSLKFGAYTIPVRTCPNLPESWVATGYPGDDLIVVDTNERLVR